MSLIATAAVAAAGALAARAYEPGWYEGMPMEEYLRILAMSASGIEIFRRSPLHFKDQQDNPKEQTPYMREGTALHLALLEPDVFEGRYIALGPCEARKGDGAVCGNTSKFYRAGHSFCGVKGHDPYPGQPMEEGLEVLTAEALDRVRAMRDAVLAHPTAKEYFRGRGCSELVGIWRDPKTGVLCKLRLDRKIDRAEFIHTDIKTTTDASKEAFTRRVGQFGYHRKASWYRRGMAELGKPATASVLVAVETPRPHGVATYILDETDLKKAGAEIDGHLEQYRQCIETGVFPGYADGLQHLKVRPWDLPEEERGPFQNEWDEAAEGEEAAAWR